MIDVLDVKVGSDSDGDTINGTVRSGFDLGTGTAQNDLMIGLGGNDILNGGGRDILHGGNGADKLIGGDDTDLLVGGNNADTLYGGGSDGSDDHAHDMLYGGDGTDTYFVGDGDFITDSDRSAVINYKGAVVTGTFKQVSSNSYSNAALGLDLVVLGTKAIIKPSNSSDEGFTVTNFQDTAGSFHNGDFGLTLQTSDTTYASVINGTASNDSYDAITNPNGHPVIGTSDNDDINGLGGNDQLFGLAGDDRIHTGPGFDIASGDEGNDQLFADTGIAYLSGGDDQDLLVGAGGDDYLGGGGNDVLYGDSTYTAQNITSTVTVAYTGPGGAPVVTFGNFDGEAVPTIGAADALWGGAGNDVLLGGIGDDVLYGEADNDWLEGNEDNDELDGGAGLPHRKIVIGSMLAQHRMANRGRAPNFMWR